MVQRYKSRFVNRTEAALLGQGSPGGVVTPDPQYTSIYALGCRQFRMFPCFEPDGISYNARMVDRLFEMPVYHLPPFECCEGKSDLVEASCWPTVGITESLTIQVVPLTSTQHCEVPECRPQQLTYSGGQWTGSVEMSGGTLNFVFTCQPLEPITQRLKLEITGCHTETIIGNTDCVFPLFWVFRISLSPTCCDCSATAGAIETDIRIWGACGFRKMAKLVDRFTGTVSGNYIDKSVYSYAECCTELGPAAPNCCRRLPCTLVATLETDDPDCQCMNGVTLNLTYTLIGVTEQWSGTFDNGCGQTVGVAVECGLDFSQCPGTYSRCTPQGYSYCQYRYYVSGDFSVAISCNSLSVRGFAFHCGECDCDGDGNPVDFEVDVPVRVEDTPDCNCGTFFRDISIVRVRIQQ